MVRDAKRTEAEIQADVWQFILSAPFELEDGDLMDVLLESPLGDRRRIDVEAGSTVIEVKRDWPLLSLSDREFPSLRAGARQRRKRAKLLRSSLSTRFQRAH